MINLLDAYFVRLAKWKIFQVLAALMLAGGIFIALFMRDKMMVYEMPFFMATLLFPVYIGIVTGVFNYPLFTNGTIRNQLAVGHKRGNIFIADWLVTNVFAVGLFLVFTLGNLVMAKILDAPGDVCWNKIYIGIVLSSLQIILSTTITQLFSVIFKGVKSFIAIYLGNQILLLMGVGAMTLEDIPKAVLYFFPSVVCLNFQYFNIPGNPLMGGANGLEVAESLERMSFEFLPAAGAAILEIAVVFIIADLYFRKTDFN